MTALIIAAAGMLICSCILMAPHTSKSAALAGSVIFSLLAGVSTAALVYTEISKLAQRVEPFGRCQVITPMDQEKTA